MKAETGDYLAKARAADGFASKLRELLPAPCRDRPFECDGLPQACDVMLIGENPATDLDEDWWLHWSDTEGCNKKTTDDAYLAARRARLERKRAEGHMRAKLISPTHSRTALLDARLRAGGSRLLVTNVYRNGHPKGAGPECVSNLDILRLLFVHMPRLAVVIVHGGKAWAGLRGVAFPRGIKPDKRDHFSRGWSDPAIEKLADEVLQAIQRAAAT
jgi:hypothetical protein